ncbi:MAG: hypothetical protein H0V12_12485 [Chloroflexi bacterium]|nr:hypothetical protein [Chloroflexota bacterium]
MKLASVMSAIGLSRRSDTALASLERALILANVYCDLPLTERSTRRDDWVRFSRSPFPPETIIFRTELLLKRLIESHIGNYGPLRGLVLLGEDVRVGASRLDLLCEDVTHRGRPLVIIELKRHQGGDRLAGQLARSRLNPIPERVSFS